MGDIFHAECLLLFFFLPWVKTDTNETDKENTQRGFESERWGMRARGAILVCTHTLTLLRLVVVQSSGC